MLVAEQPARELLQLLAGLVRVVHERRSLRTLFSRHYALLARKVAERSAATGEHYITRNGAEYRDMLWRAAGGGAVIGGTTLAKFALGALGFTALLGRLRGRRQLRTQLRADPSAALDGGDQAAGDDRAGHGPKACATSPAKKAWKALSTR